MKKSAVRTISWLARAVTALFWVVILVVNTDVQALVCAVLYLLIMAIPPRILFTVRILSRIALVVSLLPLACLAWMAYVFLTGNPAGWWTVSDTALTVLLFLGLTLALSAMPVYLLTGDKEHNNKAPQHMIDFR